MTNIRTFQQKEKSADLMLHYEKIKGKLFKIRYSPPSFCGRFQVALFKNDNGYVSDIKVKNIYCNSWRCPNCLPHIAMKVKYRLKSIIELNNLSYFLTLTLDPKKIPPDYEYDTHRYITKLFNHFITTIKRTKFTYFNTKTGKYDTFDLKKNDLVLKYVWVVEFQKNGNAHMHILLNQYIDQKLIEKIWCHVGGGNILWIEKVKSVEAVSNYVSNYLVKGVKGYQYQRKNVNELLRNEWRARNDGKPLKGLLFFQRRYSVSQSCEKPPKFHCPPIVNTNMNQSKKEELLTKMNLDWFSQLFFDGKTSLVGENFNFDNNIKKPIIQNK